MLITKNIELQRFLDHYNQDVPNAINDTSIGMESAIELFSEWAKYEGLTCKRNTYGYVIDGDNKIICPDFIVNDRYFVHIILLYKDAFHARAFQNFSERYGKIMVIPKDVVPEFVVLADAECFFERFNA